MAKAKAKVKARDEQKAKAITAPVVHLHHGDVQIVLQVLPLLLEENPHLFAFAVARKAT